MEKNRSINKSLNAVGPRENNVFGTLEKQEKLKYNGEQKQPIALVKTMITHTAA